MLLHILVMNSSLLQRLLLTLAALFALGMPRPSAASTIFWGSTFEQDVLFDAAGQPLGGEFSFEIGSFEGGFVPTMENLNDWAANWKVFDRAYDPTPLDADDGDPEGWNSTEQFFVGTVGHTLTGGSDSPDADPTDTFPQGEVIYLWVYNTKNREAGTEWALVTDGTNLGDNFSDWVFPDPTDVGSYDLMLEDADLAIVGGLNGTSGGGQPYTIQTAVIPVPEASSMLLMGVAALTGLMLRRRKCLRADAH